MSVAKVLAVASIAWPLFLTSGFHAHRQGGPAWLTATVYLSAGRVCHQRPERSFHTAGVMWPVCGRCAGLYLAAPVGAFAALVARRRGVPAVTWLVAAAAPTAATFAIEHAGVLAVSTMVRSLAALPLGAAIAYAIVAVARPPRPIG